MTFIKRIFTLVFFSVFVALQAGAAVVENPANLEDVKQALKLYQFDRLWYEAWRRQVSEQNRLYPDSPRTFALESVSDVVTVDSMAEKFAQELRKFWAANYASQFLKEAQSPTAKLSLKLEMVLNESGNEAAKAFFLKLTPKEREAINTYRASLPYLSMLNALTQLKSLKGEFITNWITGIFNQRISTNRIQAAEFLEAFVRNNQSEDKFDLLPYVKKPIPTGIRAVDAEFQLIYQLQRKKAQHMDNFNRLVPQNYIDKLLMAENYVDVVKLEEGLLKLSEYDGYYQNLFNEMEAVLDTYFQTVSSLPYEKADRQERLQKEQSSMVRALNNLLKEAEFARNLHEVTRKMLNLGIQNKGRIKFSNNTLVFEDNAALIQYRSLYAELVQISEQLVQFNKEVIQTNQKAIQSLRS